MKRVRKVFRGAVVEGFGALIFLVIVAVSMPNLLDNANLAGFTSHSHNSSADDSEQWHRIQPERRTQWLSTLRQAIYERPIDSSGSASSQIGLQVAPIAVHDVSGTDVEIDPYRSSFAGDGDSVAVQRAVLRFNE